MAASVQGAGLPWGENGAHPGEKPTHPLPGSQCQPVTCDRVVPTHPAPRDLCPKPRDTLICPLPSPEGIGSGIWLRSYSAPWGLDFASFLDTQAQAQLSGASLPTSLPPDTACGITGQRTSLPKTTGRGAYRGKAGPGVGESRRARGLARSHQWNHFGPGSAGNSAEVFPPDHWQMPTTAHPASTCWHVTPKKRTFQLQAIRTQGHQGERPKKEPALRHRPQPSSLQD